MKERAGRYTNELVKRYNEGVLENPLKDFAVKSKESGKTQILRRQIEDQANEICRLKATLKKTEMEREILKNAAAYFANHRP